MTANTYVRVTKLSPVEKANYSTPKFEDYKPGAYNGDVSLPIDYWITGTLVHNVTVGSSIIVARDCRNGVKTPGFMKTSTITKIEGNKIYTENSIYIVSSDIPTRKIS